MRVPTGRSGARVPGPMLSWHPYLDSRWEKQVNDWSKNSIWVGLYEILFKNDNIPNFYEFKQNLSLNDSNTLGFAARCEGRKNPYYLDGLKSYIFTNTTEFNIVWKQGTKLDTSKCKIYHYNSKFKDTFYNMDWGISHSCFTSEPFGYSIFEAVDYGKLPILHTSWCTELEYPYRASSKKEFKHIYTKLVNTSYEEKVKWFTQIKNYMKLNFSDKDLWVNRLLNIYNI